MICREELDQGGAEWEGLSDEAKAFVKALLVKDHAQASSVFFVFLFYLFQLGRRRRRCFLLFSVCLMRSIHRTATCRCVLTLLAVFLSPLQRPSATDALAHPWLAEGRSATDDRPLHQSVVQRIQVG